LISVPVSQRSNRRICDACRAFKLYLATKVYTFAMVLHAQLVAGSKVSK